VWTCTVVPHLLSVAAPEWHTVTPTGKEDVVPSLVARSVFVAQIVREDDMDTVSMSKPFHL
jgi:hypothetical protein